jgi:integrase
MPTPRFAFVTWTQDTYPDGKIREVCGTVRYLRPGGGGLMSRGLFTIQQNRLTAEHVKVLRDRKRGLLDAANTRGKLLRGLFKWAHDSNVGSLDHNPARDVPKLKTKGDGYHCWTAEEREKYERPHPIGWKAGLAYELFFRTGQHHSDVVVLGRRHVRDGKLCFTQTKNRRRKPISLELPILPELQGVLDASPLGEMTFLVNDYGKPFAVAGFGNKFRDWCNEAGLPAHCSAHGLRKSTATVAAENGATAHELMSIFGWLSLKEAERYTPASERRHLAERGMGRLVPIKPGTKDVYPQH